MYAKLKKNFTIANVFLKSSVIVLSCSFLVIYSISVYQQSFWPFYFFSDGLNIESYCSYHSNSSQENSFLKYNESKSKKIKIPHREIQIFSEENHLGFNKISYRCSIPSEMIPRPRELVFIHFGWIYGDHTRISIDGVESLNFNGIDKPILPISHSSLEKKSIVLDIQVVRKSETRLGFMGGTPIIISENFVVNNKIFGIETFLTQGVSIFKTIPLLVLSMVLIIGWRLGVSDRILISAMCYLSVATIDNLPQFLKDYIDIGQLAGTLTYPFSTLILTFYLLFGMELFKLEKKYTNWIYSISIPLFLSFAIFAYFAGDNVQKLNLLRQAYFSLTLIVAIFFSVLLGYKFFKETKNLKLETIFTGLTIFFMVLAMIEKYFNSKGVYVYLQHQKEFLTPLFMGGLLFYRLSEIQKDYQIQLIHRKKIENDLSIAKEIQDSLSTPEPESQFGRFQISCYQIKHSNVAGDWYAVRQIGENGFAALLVDVTGKGIQAALVVHAIQSMWAESLDFDDFSPKDWILKLNRTLCKLGEKRPHTATLGLLVSENEKLTYYSMGHTPLFGIYGQNKVRSYAKCGSVLGVNKEIQFDPNTIDDSSDEEFHLFLASDGVFELGSRTKPRQVKKLYQDVSSKGIGALDDCDQNDDRSLIYLYKK